MGRSKTRNDTKGLPYHYVEELGYYVKTTLKINGEAIPISKRWFATANEAKAWYQSEVDRLLEDGADGDPQWEEARDSYMSSKESSVAYGTRKAWEYRFKNYFEPYMGGKRVSGAFSNTAIVAFYSNLKSLSLKSDTKNAIVSQFQDFLEYVYNTTDLPEKRYKAGRSMVQRFKANPAEDTEKPTFTDEEMERFKNAWPKGSKNWIMVQAMCALGLRASEFLGLTPSDFDFEENSVRISHQMQYRDGKYESVPQLKSANSYRDMYFSPEIGKMLKGYISDMGIYPDERIFPYAPTSFNRLIKATLKEAGLDSKFSNHSIRHYLDSFLSQFCSNDRERIAKAKMMGHDAAIDINTYSSHHTEKEAKKIVAKA